MSETRPEPFFIADSTALDFLNTVARPKSEEHEWLSNGDDLLDWFVASGLVSQADAALLGRDGHRAALERAVTDIRGFRDTFRDFIHTSIAAASVPSDHAMIAMLNEYLGQGRQTLQLIAAQNADEGTGLHVVHHIQTPEDLLPRLAAACAELIADADFRYVRNCEGPSCTLVFRDVSKNHRRRWCSMEVCGNRAKAAAYRKRS